MKRRKAIRNILMIGGGTVVAYSGYKLYSIEKTPDLRYLDQRKNLIADLAEAIIPATDSPGAKDAKVEDFIIGMIKDCTEVKSQNNFISGLNNLEDYCKSNFNNEFGRCNEQQQNEVLNHFQDKAREPAGIIGKAEDRFLGRPFFTTLKEYTVRGYCASEIGATKGLRYIAIPGRYAGCISMEAGEKSWATK